MADSRTGAELAAGIVQHGPDECWSWRGLRYVGSDQPCVLVSDTHVQAARIAAWEHRNGLVPEGFVVRHACGNRDCLNPRHMAIGPSKRKGSSGD